MLRLRVSQLILSTRVDLWHPAVSLTVGHTVNTTTAMHVAIKCQHPPWAPLRQGCLHVHQILHIHLSHISYMPWSIHIG